MRIATTHTTVKVKIPTTGAELLRTPTNMPGQYSYTFMAQSTHTTIAFEEIVATNSTILLCNFTLHEVGGRYVAGFQGQHADDEVAGSGNSYTAEFWQYDSRLGRRWNVDPVVVPSVSSFSVFFNNPVYYIDPEGLTPSDNKPIPDLPKGYEVAPFRTSLKNLFGKIGTFIQNLNPFRSRTMVWVHSFAKKKIRNKFEFRQVIYEVFKEVNTISEITGDYRKRTWNIPFTFTVPNIPIPNGIEYKSSLKIFPSSGNGKILGSITYNDVKSGEQYSGKATFIIDEELYRQANELKDGFRGQGDLDNHTRYAIGYSLEAISIPVVVKVPIGFLGRRNWKKSTIETANGIKLSGKPIKRIRL